MEIYLRLPEGANELSSKVVRLRKALYGLKQAPNSWYECFTNFIIQNLKFTQSKSDQCIFMKISKNQNLIIFAIYVDDVLLEYNPNDIGEINDLKHNLLSRFRGKDFRYN